MDDLGKLKTILLIRWDNREKKNHKTHRSSFAIWYSNEIKLPWFSMVPTSLTHPEVIGVSFSDGEKLLSLPSLPISLHPQKSSCLPGHLEQLFDSSRSLQSAIPAFRHCTFNITCNCVLCYWNVLTNSSGRHGHKAIARDIQLWDCQLITKHWPEQNKQLQPSLPSRLFRKILDTNLSLTTALHQMILTLRRTDPPADISRRRTPVGRSCLSYRRTSHTAAPLGFLGSCLTPFILMETQIDYPDESTSPLSQEEIEASRVCSAKAAGGERTVVWKAYPVPEGWYAAQHPWREQVSSTRNTMASWTHFQHSFHIAAMINTWLREGGKHFLRQEMIWQVVLLTALTQWTEISQPNKSAFLSNFIVPAT